MQCLNFSRSTRICLEGLWFSAVRARPSSSGPHSQKDSWASGTRGRNQKASLSLRSGILSFFQIKRSSIRKGMVMVSPRLNPQASWEFEAEILVLHHPTTISPRYQAMGRCRRALPAQGAPRSRTSTKCSSDPNTKTQLQPKGRPPSCLVMPSVPPTSCSVCSVLQTRTGCGSVPTVSTECCCVLGVAKVLGTKTRWAKAPPSRSEQSREGTHASTMPCMQELGHGSGDRWGLTGGKGRRVWGRIRSQSSIQLAWPP